MLWEHTCQLLSTPSNEGPDQTVDHAMTGLISTPKSNTKLAPFNDTADEQPILSVRTPANLDQSMNVTPTSTFSRKWSEGPPRKSHTKSRKGCKVCKKEHIRCDEQFPQW